VKSVAIGCRFQLPAGTKNICARQSLPDDQLTIVVLTNTEGQNAYAISAALARAILGLPELPKPRDARPVMSLVDNLFGRRDAEVTGRSCSTRARCRRNLHDSYAQYRRTYRVFNENGRLMIQPPGFGAERLLKQRTESFAMRSSRAGESRSS